MFDIKRAISWIRETWWGIVVAYTINFVVVYGVLWYFLEPPDILDGIDYNRFATRPIFFWTLTILLSSHLTLVLEIIFRRTRWAPRNIDPKELKRFHQEIKPLLKYISSLPKAQLSPAEVQTLSRTIPGIGSQERVIILTTTDIQNLVKKTVRVMTRMHFGVPELPNLMCFDSIPFDDDEEFNCPICIGKNVGIMGTGQCERCKLCCTAWLGIREPSSQEK